MEKEVRKSILVIVLLLVIILIIFLAYILGYTKYVECSSDADCVKVQTSCCPCESAGEEKCFSKELVPAQKICEKIFCAELYNCNIEKCICEKGRCVEKIK